MKKEFTFKCRSIAEGKASGEAIISSDAVCFYLVEPETGLVVEKNHALKDQNIAKKILVMPSGKGSSVVQADGLYKLAKYNNAPTAMIVEYPDPVLVSGAIVMEVPLVDSVEKGFYETVQDGDIVIVDADQEMVTVQKK